MPIKKSETSYIQSDHRYLLAAGLCGFFLSLVIYYLKLDFHFALVPGICTGLTLATIILRENIKDNHPVAAGRLQLLSVFWVSITLVSVFINSIQL